MTLPARAHTPDRTHRAADYLLPPLTAAVAAALCLFLWTPDGQAQLRTPAFFGGLLAGLLVPRLYWSRYRVLGFAPYAATAAAVLLIAVGGPFDDRPPWQIGLFTLLEGVAIGAVVWHRDRFRVEYGRHLAAAGLAAAVGVGLVAAFTASGPTDPGVRDAYWWLLVVSAVWAPVQAWLALLRPAVEVAAEPLLWLMYRVRTAGPGTAEFPRSGPALVIANHAAWFDPLYLAKVLPRPVTPMMTARFYNLPVLRPMLRHIVGVIVVPETPMRREAPEVQQAVSALDAGRVVVIFPEGYLRRKEEQLLRRFGQGVWQILKARPATPVIACWIEGAWGSYASYHGGPPTKNKRLDIRRPIAIGLSAPETVPPEVLADHLPTRVYLMNKVLEARKHLGLPPVPPVELPGKDNGNADDADERE
jgi:1-acyl-sn-glycerol-3-phosphate acyltransferase